MLTFAFLKKYFNLKLMAICLLLLSAVSQGAAIAGYVPDKDQKPPSSNTTSSSQ
jgi:hypothetical protein